MNWDTSRILGPRWVSTPNLQEDVDRLFCLKEGEHTDLAAMDPAQKDKVTVLAERLEFVEHLTVIATEFRKRTTRTRRHTRLDEKRILVTDTCRLELWGHDFAGADFDLEALILYLLITCIDTIKGQPLFVSAFDWMLQHHARRLSNLEPDEVPHVLNELSVSYRAEHGLSRRFVEAFAVDLSEDMKERLVRSFAVVKIDGGQITKESASAWEQRSTPDKIKKLASTLYTVRSTFTHAAIRSFCPSQPVEELQGGKDAVVVQLPDGEPLLSLMQDIVVFLTRKLVIGHPKH